MDPTNVCYPQIRPMAYGLPKPQASQSGLNVLSPSRIAMASRFRSISRPAASFLKHAAKKPNRPTAIPLPPIPK